MKPEDNISKQVREGFESLNEKAPDIWSKLDGELNNQNGVDHLVRDSFEQNNFVAPDLWSSLNHELSDQKGVDHLVKNSFEEDLNSAPDHVWENVQNRMDVDRVWNRISDYLDNRKRFIFWRSIAATLLLLLGLSAYLFQTNEIDATLGQLELNRDLNHGFSNEEIDQNSPLVIHDVDDEVYTVFRNEPVEEFSADHFPSEVSDTRIVEPLRMTPVLPMKTTEISLIDLKIIDNQDPLRTGDGKYILPEFIRPDDPMLSIGLVGGLNNNWLIDGTLKEGLSANSLLSANPAFSGNFGIVADVRINKKSGFMNEIFFFSRMNQVIGMYVQGNYILKKTEINYSKISLQYYRTLSFNSTRNLQPLKASAGIYYAFGRNSMVKMDDIITSYNTEFKRHDFGLRASFVQEFNYASWVFGLGLQSETGLTNISAGIGESPSAGKTTNFNIGLLVNARYVIGQKK